MTHGHVAAPGVSDAGWLAGFPGLPESVLGPLIGRPHTVWHHAPQGKWSAAQIVDHLAISLDSSGRRFDERRERAPMRRRSRGMLALAAYGVVVRLGWFPRGFPAPAGTRPGDHPDPAAVTQRFREGHARFVELAPKLLPARRHDLFVKHPVIGDLTFEEWQRFHVVHCRHHVRQIRERLAG